MVRSSRPRPTMDLTFYLSTIKKIYTYGFRVSQAHYKLIHHVNMQFNKIPTTSYAMQQETGHDFTRNREGNYSNPWANRVKPNVIEGTHKLSTTHFVLCTQSFNSSISWLRQLMHWEWRGMAVNFILGKAINLGNSILLVGEENT